MKTITVNSRKHGTHFVTVDDQDYELCLSLGLYIASNTYGMLYVRSSALRKPLHRILTNCVDGKVVDHINRNTFDNRRQNIRIVTQRENLRNRGTFRSNKLGERLISKTHSNGEPAYQICYTDGSRRRISVCKSLSDAIALRNQILKEHYSFTSNVSTQGTQP